MLEIQKQSQAQFGYRKVSGHLSQVGGTELFYYLGVHDDQPRNQQIRDKDVDQLTAVAHLKAALLFDLKSAVTELNSQRILIGFFVKPRFELVQDIHCRTNDRVAQFGMKQIIMFHRDISNCPRKERWPVTPDS